MNLRVCYANSQPFSFQWPGMFDISLSLYNMYNTYIIHIYNMYIPNRLLTFELERREDRWLKMSRRLQNLAKYPLIVVSMLYLLAVHIDAVVIIFWVHNKSSPLTPAGGNVRTVVFVQILAEISCKRHIFIFKEKSHLFGLF